MKLNLSEMTGFFMGKEIITGHGDGLIKPCRREKGMINFGGPTKWGVKSSSWKKTTKLFCVR
jgi:hypothetical protein